jgi:hypothetical protein
MRAVRFSGSILWEKNFYRAPLISQIIAEKKLLRESSAQIREICGRKEVFRANPLVELS